MRTVEGVFALRDATGIVRRSRADLILVRAAQWLRRLVKAPCLDSIQPASPASILTPHPHAITLERTTSRRGEQWYALSIRPTGIRLRASAEPGFRYGVLTLSQLMTAGHPVIRAMDIEDWPDFPARGVLIDISLDKVPTMATLKRLIDMLASWKINQIQLYMEHTFAYAGREEVWRGASPMTGAQIKTLDRFCRERCVELAPNQNSLGHMERWLRHDRYAHLAECAGPWTTPWGEVRDTPSTLCPVDRGAIQLVGSLYDQLLPHFSGRLLNVGCDEPWELGQGRSRRACRRRGPARVYFEYLMKVRRAAARHGRRIMFWSDWIQNHQELIAELPDDIVPLVWGYEADYPFERHCRRLRGRGLDFYVCPGTSSWCSIAGRTSNCLANLKNAATAGQRLRAAGYLVTDWGDYGHRQYLPVSYAGFLYGAALGWCVKTNAGMNVAVELGRHVYNDATGDAGRLWLEAGKVHELSGVVLNNRSLPFACLHAPLGDTAGVEGLAEGRAERMTARVSELKAAAAKQRFGGADGALAKDELKATLAVLNHACKRAAFNVAKRTGERPAVTLRWLAKDMERIIERHRTLWLKRNRRGGLASSLGYYRRNLNEYRALM